LEEEYLFIDVVSTYLRAIRVGAVNVRHGAVLLAHYGRLGPAFDACVKIVVDVLREEGMMYDNADVVVTVVTQAMQEVSHPRSLDACRSRLFVQAFNLVLDGIVHGEDNCIQLAKALSGCLVIRGSQLSIVKRLEGQYLIQIHTTLVSYLIQRLTAYEKNKNKKSFKTAMSFFRALVPLLLAVQSRNALEMYAAKHSFR
jgi:cohesin complex subunit SA-1/2